MDLSDRIKQYESVYDTVLEHDLPVIVRLDGKNFHTWTKGCKRPFDLNIQNIFDDVTKYLIKQTNAVVGYTQSDEITLILYNYGRPESQIIFDGRVNKLNSVLASMASASFNYLCEIHMPKDMPLAFFDCRCFTVPNEIEATNALIWRELDCSRNAVSMAARHYFSQKMLHGKSSNNMKDMLIQDKGINFEDYPDRFKFGAYFKRESVSGAEEFSNNIKSLLKIKNRVGVVFYDETPIY
jgi:tRNA(His) guanylyltransferase